MTACYIVDGRICERLIVRFYATDATTYCCVWLYKDGKAHNGSGKAGGWGYDRSSAALDQAFKAMGIDFGHTLSGTGQNEEAIIKIGRELGEEWQVMTAQG